MRILPFDTDKKTIKRQYDILVKMDINSRSEMVFQLSDNLRSLLEAGVRDRHPDYSETKIREAVLSLTLDKEIFKQAFPDYEGSA